MNETLNKSYTPSEVEKKWYAFWEKHGFFKADAKSPKPSYCIVLPPPNVTGALHMGHALVDTVQDTLIRWKRMSGFEALWVPGVDHAGIATQTVVERHLIKTLGKRRKDFSREEFLSHVWDWKNKNEENIISQLKKVGCSCDWSRNRFTMDEMSNKAVRTIFKKMYDEGLIYRGDYLVNWDPLTQTALADDEVEYEEKNGFMWFINYKVENSNESITIATTRPETLLGDVAVAVNPQDQRYQHLIGKFLALPLSDRKIPVIADHYVDPSFGTGAVKITPAHDFNDYEVGLRHNLEMINIMTSDGKINENGNEFCGLTVLEAREAVVLALKEKSLLVKQEPHMNRVGISYRSKAIIEPYLSKQWFVKMSSFKKELRSLVEEKKVKMVPPHFESTYFHWIDNLRDWCISRQLWWGHQIPIWYDVEDSSKVICYDGEDLPEEVRKNPSQYKRDEDVLDTWFSSALWPFSTLGWPDQTEDLAKFYPTSTLITGHDILFFWVARMIMMGKYALGDVPFHETFLHGLIYGKSYWKVDSHGQLSYLTSSEKLDYDLGKPLPKEIESKWEKMSKTKGNVIDPLEIIESYGADAMRMALLSSLTHARQIDLDRRRFEEFKNFANKLWNSARFVLMNLEESNSYKALDEAHILSGIDLSLFELEDKWILRELNEVINQINKYLTNYEFDKASHALYSFFWDKFCAYYVEIVKPTLFGKIGTLELRENKQKILLVVLLGSIRLMHPFVPFITEEIFQKLKEKFPNLKIKSDVDPYTKDLIETLLSSACIVAPFPKMIDQFSDSIEQEFEFINKILYTIRNIRGEMQLPPQSACDIIFSSKTSLINLERVKKNQHIISALIKTKEILFIPKAPADLDFFASSQTEEVEIMIPLPSELREKEKARLAAQIQKLEQQIGDLKNKLLNEEFLLKAPKPLIEKFQKNLEDNQNLFNELEKKLKEL